METILLATITVTFKLMICVALYGMYRTISQSTEFHNLSVASDKLVGEISYSINVYQRAFWSRINQLTDKGSKKVNYFQF